MKLINLQEEDNIIDLDKRREQKREEDQPVSIQEALLNIDETLELTITYLVHQGMSEGDARGVVLKHLSDIVMADDLGA